MMKPAMKKRRTEITRGWATVNPTLVTVAADAQQTANSNPMKINLKLDEIFKKQNLSFQDNNSVHGSQIHLRTLSA